MRRLIAGESQHRIAEDLGMTESRISIICNSPLFKRELKKLEDEVKDRYIDTTAAVQQRLNSLQPAAVDILESILNKNEVNGKMVSLPLKRETALDVLELAGNGKKKNTTVADAMSDVVKIISDGFKLAKELKAQQNGNGNGNGNGIIHKGQSGEVAKESTPQMNASDQIIPSPDGPTIVNMEETEYNISDASQ